MKAKTILMSILLAMGFIAAKAATGYPPELALVSQPVMVYNYNSITVYYDVQNIGDYTYRGHIYLYLNPDNGYFYADKYVKVRPGRIKRVAIEIPAYTPNPAWAYTIMPYYEMGNELYSFTTFEYFEPLSFYWNGPRNERWIVINLLPRPRRYVRPGTYRYYYDGYRPPMLVGNGLVTPPLNPMHHTYSYHYNNGGYPANYHNNATEPSNVTEPSNATVRPNPNAGSMSSGNSHTAGSSSSSSSGRVSNSSSSSRPSGSSSSSSSGRVGSSSSNSRPSGSSGSSSSGRVSSSSSNSRPSGSSGSSSSGRVSSSSSNSRPSGSSSSSSSGRVGSSSSNSRPSGSSSSSSSGRVGSSSSNSRPSGSSSSSSSGRVGSSSSNSRTGSSSSGRSGNANSGRSGR